MTQTQQQRPESPTVTPTWHASKDKAHKVHQKYIEEAMPLAGSVLIMVCLYAEIQIFLNNLWSSVVPGMESVDPYHVSVPVFSSVSASVGDGNITSQPPF